MIKCDYHVHSEFSFDAKKDGSASVDAIVQSAIEKHYTEIAITDHCDIDGILDGIYPPYPAFQLHGAIEEAKSKYAGKIRILRGIELGQPHVRPNEAYDLVQKEQYDFVIGSLHNLRSYPDFAFLKYEMMTPSHIALLVRRSISELCEIAEFSGLSTLAHITYVQRYLAKSGVEFDFTPFLDEYRELFRIMIRNGVALEVNTSNLKNGGVTMPDEALLKLYRDVGGKMLTLGSDAHSPEFIGNGFDRAVKMLRELGFCEKTVFRNKKPKQVKL